MSEQPTSPETLTPVPAVPYEPVSGEHPRRGAGSRAGVTLLVLAALAGGLVAGAYWHEPIAHRLGLHSHKPGAGGKKQIWTCGMHPQVIKYEPGLCPICQMKLEPLDVVQSGNSAMTGGSGAATTPGAVQIDPVVVQNMGVRVAEVQRGPLVQDVRAVGYLDEAQPNVRDVNLRVSGWVEKLYADTVGMALSKGTPLFDLYSPEVQVATEELIAARRSLESLGPKADPLARKTTESLAEATRLKLEQWGLDAKEVDRLSRLDRAPRTVTFTSPIDGYLMQKMVVQGTAVKAGDMALQIVDLSTLWLDVQVYARDLPSIQLGQRVTADVEGMPGRSFAGEVVFVHPQIDPQTRTATVRVALPNNELTLRPGMYATAHIRTRPADDVPLVPREAVLDTGTRQVVFVTGGAPGHFAPREVKLGASGTDGMVQVLDGLAPGESVVTSGQFLLDAESRMREAVQKHLNDALLVRGEPARGGENAGVAKVADRGSEITDVKSGVSGPTSRTVAWSAELDDLVKQYLVLQQRLGAPQTADEPVEVGKLVQSADALAQSAGGDAQSLSQVVAKAAAAMRGKPLTEQRKLFHPPSDAVIALAQAGPPSKAVADKLYIAHCPMIPGGSARWLQPTDQVANPYFATSMKACGTIQGTIETAAATPVRGNGE